MKSIRYIKFAISILFLEILLGRLCYEYGYARGGDISGIGGMYVLAVYALIYLVICICQCWDKTSLGSSIFSTVFLGVPYIALIIFACLPSTDVIELSFTVVLFIAWGIALVLETVALVLEIKKYMLAKKE